MGCAGQSYHQIEVDASGAPTFAGAIVFLADEYYSDTEYMNTLYALFV